MSWRFGHPTRIVAGPGALAELGSTAIGRTLVVTTPGATERGLTERLLAVLGPDRAVVHDRVESNPGLEGLDASIEEVRACGAVSVVAAGGGSAMDTGKVLALALASPGKRVHDLVDSAELPAGAAPVPVVAVPTTAGTGSEVTPFATVWDKATCRKLSVTGPSLFPHVALVDPTLTWDLGWDVTVSSGLDAYVQCFEAISNRNATTVTTALAAHGLALASEALPALKEDLGATEARRRMAEAALLSGLAISHTRTALAHSMSYPITAHLGVPHGLACALVLPAVLEFNLGDDDGRLAEFSRRGGVDPDDLVESVVDLLLALEVPQAVSRYVESLDAIELLADEMLTPARSDNNMRSADAEDVRAILRRTTDLVGMERAR